MTNFSQESLVELLANIIQLSPDIITVLDKEGNIIYKSQSIEKIHGYTEEELVGLNTFDLMHPEDRQKMLDIMDYIIKNPKEKVQVQFRYRNKDGSYTWMESTTNNQLDNPLIKGLIIVSRDITERKKHELELQKNKEELQKILESFPDYYLIFDRTGLIIEANPKFTIKGFIPIVNKSLKDCIPILEYQKIKNEFKKNYIPNQIFSFEIDYLNQRLEIKIVPFKEQEMICIIKDITDKYQTIKEIEASESRYKSLFFNAPSGIAQLTQNFYFQKVNPALCKLLGYKEEELIGKSIFDFLQESKDEVFIQFINQFLSSHDPFEMDLPFLNSRNETIYVNLKINTVSNSLGITQYLLAYFVDVTAIKQNQQFMQESLKEKESLIKEIHHRVKNNLQVISSLLSLQMSHIKSKETFETFRITQSRVHSIALLHDQLYKSNSLNQVIMSDYIQILTKNLIHSYNRHISTVQLNFQLEHFILDIEQASPIAIIANELISNSLKHAKTDEKELLELKIQYQVHEGKHFLRFKDNGIGLPENFDIKKVRTLGLSLVNILTKQINGKLDWYNENGANFELVF